MGVVIIIVIIIIALVVGWGAPMASRAGSLGVCQWVKTGSSRVLGEMCPTWVLEEETLVQVSETGKEREKERGMEEGSSLCKIRTRIETLAPTEQEGGIPETKRGADGASLAARRERWEATTTPITTPSPKETPPVPLADYLLPQC